MVVFDTSTLVLIIDPSVKGPIDPSTSKPVEHCKERVEYLIKQLNDSRTRIMIPAPVLSEFLVKAGPNRNSYINEFLNTSSYLLAPFDYLAAIELALLEDVELKSGKKLDEKTTKAKVKFDRQILAIAKVNRASMIYTDDLSLAKLAKDNGIDSTMTWDIPLPPEKVQRDLPLTDPNKNEQESE